MLHQCCRRDGEVDETNYRWPPERPAANGTYSDDDISAMNDEYGELAEELGSVMSNTSFGGTSLLDTSSGKWAVAPSHSRLAPVPMKRWR